MRKALAISLMVLLVAAGCSSREAPSGDRSLLTEEEKADAKAAKKAAGKKGGKGGRVSRKEALDNAKQAGGADSIGSGTASVDTDVPGADEDKQYPTASAQITESQADAKSQGITPSYAEMTHASVEGLGKTFRITMTFAGDLPQKMPNDKTVMVVGYQMIRDDDEGYAFAAQASQEGWKPFAGGKEDRKQKDFPGSFEVVGNEIVMEIPWSFVNGAYPFKWLATSNWFQSLANTTHYKFDLIPNKDQANYPG